jgi:acyl-CoA thioesterase-2
MTWLNMFPPPFLLDRRLVYRARGYARRVSETGRPIDFRALLAVEDAGENAFTAHLHDYGEGRSFGGDVLGRVALAARRTCEPERRLVSFYGLFLRPGPVGRPVRIEVERVKDGRRLAQRRVRMLDDERLVADLTASFAVASHGPGWSSVAAPDVPAPHALPSEEEAARVRGEVWRPGELEWRFVDRVFVDRSPGSSRWRAWARPRRRLPEDAGLHEAALAYLSDFISHGSVVRMLGERFAWQRFASLDQGLWVHRPVRWDGWFLVESESDVAAEGHTFTRRRVFDTEGRLLATGSQEGIHPDP